MTNTLKPIVVGKARALLDSSSPEILKPFACKHGTLQVVWIEAIDAHGLFFQHSEDTSASLLATHHNGYSCHALGERVASGDTKRVNEQLEYIRRCGGTATIVDFGNETVAA